jgi:vacuolar-type H+-ATPase subunit H
MPEAAAGEIATLERLRADEMALDTVLEQARARASSIVQDAVAESRRLTEESRARLEKELRLMCDEAGRELNRTMAELDREAERRVMALRSAASRNAGQAVDLVLAQVLKRPGG